MKLSSVQRFLAALVATYLAACSFDPAVERPGFSDDDDANDTIVDMSSSNDDAEVPNDASGTSDGDHLPDGTSPPDVTPPWDMTPPEDVTVAVDATDRDATPPFSDMSAPDTSAPDMSVPDMSAPDLPPDVCDGVTVNLNDDPDHCGSCDNACDPLYGECRGGECRCEHGAEACGQDNTCRDLDYDSRHCGMCGRACAVGEVCLQGSCACRADLIRCNGVCVDPMTDPSHCGACNNDCAGKACLDGACRDRANCPVGTWSCNRPGGKACIRGDESDLYCDPGLFDMCGTECLGDEVCIDPGILASPRCVTYRPGIGCTDCPCADCTADERCETTDDIANVAYCLSR